MQPRLIEGDPATLIFIPLGELREKARTVGKPGTAALARAIEEDGFESTLHLSLKENGTYVVRKGNGRLQTLLDLANKEDSGFTDDVEVPCFVRIWNGPEDDIDIIRDHAVQRENAIAEFVAVRRLLGTMNDAAIARCTGMRKDRVRALGNMIDMHPDLLAGFLDNKIATSVAEKVSRRPMAEQERAAGIYHETGQLRVKDLTALRTAVVADVGERVTQSQLFEGPEVWSAYMEDDVAYISIPGKGDYQIDADKLLEFLDGQGEGEE